jgi:hypothetical protein
VTESRTTHDGRRTPDDAWRTTDAGWRMTEAATIAVFVSAL